MTHCSRSGGIGTSTSSTLGRSPPWEQGPVTCLTPVSPLPIHVSLRRSASSFNAQPTVHPPPKGTRKGSGCVSPECTNSPQPQPRTQSTDLHEALLHVGGKILQDTQLRLQSPRHSAHREGEVLSAGGVVVHSPGGSGQRQRSESPAPTPPPQRLQDREPRSSVAALLSTEAWIQGTPS